MGSIKMNSNGHRLKRLRAHGFWYCETCNEVVKQDGTLVEGGEIHGI